MKRVLIIFLTLFMLSTNLCFNTVYADGIAIFDKGNDVDITLTNTAMTKDDIISESGVWIYSIDFPSPENDALLIYGTDDNFNYKALKYDGSKWIEVENKYKISDLKNYSGNVHLLGEGHIDFSIETMDELAYFFSMGGDATLANDISGTDKFLIIDGKECNLSLSGKKITFGYRGETLTNNGSASLSPSTKNTSITLKGNAVLNVKNGELNNSYNEGIKETYLFVVEGNAHLTLDDVDANGSNTRVFYNLGTTELKNNSTANSTRKETIWNKGTFKINDSKITSYNSGYIKISHDIIWNYAGNLIFECPNVTMTSFSNQGDTFITRFIYAKGGNVIVNSGTMPGGIAIDDGATLSVSGTNAAIADGEKKGITVNGGGTLNVEDGASVSTGINLNSNANLNLDSGSISGQVNLSAGAKFKIDSAYTTSNKIKVQLNYNKNQLPFAITQASSVNQLELLNILNPTDLIIYDEVNESNHVVKAKEDIRVIYNDNGSTSGTVPVDETQYEKGTEVTVKSNSGKLEKTGYKYTGWNTSASGNETHFNEGETFSISGKTTLYAEWEQMYQIVYDGNGSTSGSVPVDNNYYEKNKEATVKDNVGSLAKDGYEFIGWNTKADGTGTTYLPEAKINVGSKNIKLFAMWSHSHDGIVYDKLITGAGELTSGNYYLDGDISLSGPMIIGEYQNVRICLNGHVIDASGFSDNNVIKVNHHANLVIDDCKHDSAIHNYDIDSSTKLATLNENSGATTIKGGAIYGGVKSKYDINSGIRSCALYVSYDSKVTLNALNILGFNTSTGFLIHSGSVGSEIILGEGVNITNNATSNVIDALICTDKVILNGAKINNNTIVQDGNNTYGNIAGAIIDTQRMEITGGEISNNNIFWDKYYSGLICSATAADKEISNLTISNNTIQNNGTEKVDGILIETDNANLTINKLTLSNNSYSGKGAINGLVYAGNNLTVNNQTKINNNTIGVSISGGYSQECGGLLAAGRDMEINNTSIDSNELNYTNVRPTGAIIEVGYANYSKLTINASNIVNNKVNANSSWKVSGVLINIKSNADSLISNSNINSNIVNVINDNDKGINGGLIYSNNNELKLVNTNLSNNTVSSKGSINGGLLYINAVSTSGCNFNNNSVTSSSGSIKGGLIQASSIGGTTIEESKLNSNTISSYCRDYADRLTIDNGTIYKSDVKRGVVGGLIDSNYSLTIKDDNFNGSYKNEIKNNVISISGLDGDDLSTYGYLLNTNNAGFKHLNIDGNSISFGTESGSANSYVLGGIFANYLNAEDLSFKNNSASGSSVFGMLSYGEYDTSISGLNALKNKAVSTSNAYGSMIYQKQSRYYDSTMSLSGTIAGNEVKIGGDAKGGLIYGNNLNFHNLTIEKVGDKANSVVCTSSSGEIAGGIAYGNSISMEDTKIDNSSVSYQKVNGLIGLAQYNLSLKDTSITNNVAINTSTSGNQGVLVIDEYRYDDSDKDHYSYSLDGEVIIKDNIINGKEEGIVISCYGMESNCIEIEESLSGTSYIPFSYLYKKHYRDQKTFYEDLLKETIKIVDFADPSVEAQNYLNCFINTDDLFALSAKDNAIYYGTRVVKEPTIEDCTFYINTSDLQAGDITYQWYRVIDGVENSLSGQTSKSLNTSLYSIGTYYCLATIKDTDSYSSNIVNFEPVINKQPTSSNNYTFEIKDNCNVEYKWYELTAKNNDKKTVNNTIASDTNFDYYDDYEEHTYTYEATYDEIKKVWSSSSGNLFGLDVTLKKDEVLVFNCDKNVYSYMYINHNLSNYYYFIDAFVAPYDGTFTLVLENNYYYPDNIKGVNVTVDIYSSFSDINPTIASEIRYDEILGEKVYSKYNAATNSYEGIDGYYQAIKLNLTEGDIYLFEYDGADIDYAYTYMINEDELAEYDSIDQLYDFDLLEAYVCQESGTYYFITRIYNEDDVRIYPSIKINQVNGYTLTDTQLTSNKLSKAFSGKYVCLAKCTDASSDYYHFYSNVVDYSDDRVRVTQLKELKTGNIISEVNLNRENGYNFGEINAGLYGLEINNDGKHGYTFIDLKAKTSVSGNSNELLLDNVDYEVKFAEDTPYCLIKGLKELAKEYESNDYNNKLSLNIALIKRDSSEVFTKLIDLIKNSKFASNNFVFYDINIDAIINSESKVIHETEDKMITIVIPFDTEHNDNFAIARCHVYGEDDVIYDILPQGVNNANENGEYYEIHKGYLELHLNKFSIYAIGYKPIIKISKKYDIVNTNVH